MVNPHANIVNHYGEEICYHPEASSNLFFGNHFRKGLQWYVKSRTSVQNISSNQYCGYKTTLNSIAITVSIKQCNNSCTEELKWAKQHSSIEKFAHIFNISYKLTNEPSDTINKQPQSHNTNLQLSITTRFTCTVMHIICITCTKMKHTNLKWSFNSIHFVCVHSITLYI